MEGTTTLLFDFSTRILREAFREFYHQGLHCHSISVKPIWKIWMALENGENEMCGRFNIKSSGQEIAQKLQATLFGDFQPGYNVAPTDPVLVLDIESTEKATDRRLRPFSWGLIPRWVKDLKDWKIRINARCETVSTNGCFRSAFRSRRCLIPMTGFYEWQASDSGGKQPFEIQAGNTDEIFCVAGIWETWIGEDPRSGEQVEKSTVCVITCPPNKLMAGIHDRMPVIVPADSWDAWLDDSADFDFIHSLMVPYPADQMDAWPISTTVNNARNKSAAAIQKLAF